MGFLRTLFSKRESKDEIADRIFALCDKDYPDYKEKHKDNILAPPIKANTAMHELIAHLLGENWYVSYSCGDEQVFTEALFEIEQKYKRVK